MKIENYKYNKESFEQEGYELLIKFDEANDRLKKQEGFIKKDVNNMSLSYFKAYLNYMRAGNEHMASFMPYLKHEYEMLNVLMNTNGNDSEIRNQANMLIDKIKTAFDFYGDLHKQLKEIEFDLKEAIESFESNKFKEDLLNLFTLQTLLQKLSIKDYIINKNAELYREQFAFPLVEECLKFRNKGKKFETYQERSKKIVEEQSEPQN